MKVAIVNNHFASHNGADVVAYALFCKLREEGIETVFYGSQQPPYYEPDYEHIPLFGEAKPYKDMSLAERALKAFDMFYTPSHYTKFKRFLEVTKPDIVHYHSINRYLTAAVLQAAYDLNIPTVQTLHDAFLACPASTLLRAEKIYCDTAICATKNAFACVENRCMRQNTFKSLYFAAEFEIRKLHQLYFKSDAYIVPSKALKTLMQKTPLPADRVHVIGNPLDEQYEAIEPHFQGGSYLLYVGRLVREKGLHYLLEAMRAFPDMELRIIGDGPSRADYEALKEDYNLENVHFYGKLSPPELQQHYENCLALVHPCNCYEAFGLTIIEGQAHGKAVIASNIGAINELINDKETGLLVKAGSITALQEAITYLRDNPEEACRIGKQARKQLIAKQLSSQFFEKTIALYKDVIERRQVSLTSIKAKTPILAH